MKNADMPAMPVVEFDDSVGSKDGLTKREHFAAMAMQGLLSNLAAIRREGFRDAEIEQFALMRADALLAALENS